MRLGRRPTERAIHRTKKTARELFCCRVVGNVTTMSVVVVLTIRSWCSLLSVCTLANAMNITCACSLNICVLMFDGCHVFFLVLCFETFCCGRSDETSSASPEVLQALAARFACFLMWLSSQRQRLRCLSSPGQLNWCSPLVVRSRFLSVPVLRHRRVICCCRSLLDPFGPRSSLIGSSFAHAEASTLLVSISPSISVPAV